MMGPGKHYCRGCRTVSVWSYGKAIMTRWFTNTRPGDPNVYTTNETCLKCGNCGRSITVGPRPANVSIGVPSRVFGHINR